MKEEKRKKCPIGKGGSQRAFFLVPSNKAKAA
jgi:hypothetical protein